MHHSVDLHYCTREQHDQHETHAYQQRFHDQHHQHGQQQRLVEQQQILDEHPHPFYQRRDLMINIKWIWIFRMFCISLIKNIRFFLFFPFGKIVHWMDILRSYKSILINALPITSCLLNIIWFQARCSNNLKVQRKLHIKTLKQLLYFIHYLLNK